MEHTKSIKMYGPGDYAAIVDGEPVSYHATAIAAKAAADAYVYDLIEMEAREADLTHDVQQAATDSDVVAALVDNTAADAISAAIIQSEQTDPESTMGLYQNMGGPLTFCDKLTRENAATASMPPLNHRDRCIWIAVRNHRLGPDAAPTQPLPEYPAFLYYDRNQGGVVWAGSPTAYPSYIEAARERDGK